ncbi:MAG: hypothetical protein IPN95_30880 [Bacteroidetes bacterium]|nr:hypothetical protein [Bacteroidota bacterium]
MSEAAASLNSPDRQFMRTWLPLLVVLSAAFAWAYFFYFQSELPPFEDAAMLLRYSDHLAQGHGIVWNIGEAPVDGATDFLFMVMVAGLAKLGLNVATAARLLGLTAHFLTVAFVYRMHIRRGNGTALAAGISALIVATGPGLNYCEALFGTSVFAFAGLVTYSFFLRLMEDESRPGLTTGFAVAGILTGLIRPEGVVLVIGMLASLLWYLRGPIRKQLIQRFLLLFCIPGLIYFIWHWVYFGRPLPNPFYVKGKGNLYLSSLKASFVGVVKMGGILLPIMAWAAWKKDARRKTMLLYAPIVLFAVAWILMSNAMNFSNRFQYILMPIMWVAWLPIVEMMRPGFTFRGKWLIAGIPLAVLMLAFQWFVYAREPRIHQDGRAELGKALRPWKSKGYTMAITEAGNLPFFSEWKAIDTWGLNDKTVARQGIIGEWYLDEYRPALFMIHDYWSPGIPKINDGSQWMAMTNTLEGYLRFNNYKMVACWGREPQSTHFYYLRSDLPDFDSLQQLISEFPYIWYEDGYPAENFLQVD